MWIRIKNRPDSKHAYRYGHAKCLDAFNEAVEYGINRGDCGDKACCFSARYDVEHSNAAREARIAALDAAEARP